MHSYQVYSLDYNLVNKLSHFNESKLHP